MRQTGTRTVGATQPDTSLCSRSRPNSRDTFPQRSLSDELICQRHFYASVLLDAGESIKALSEWLGHADPAFTMRVYAHLMPASAERARQAIGRLLMADGNSGRRCSGRPANRRRPSRCRNRLMRPEGESMKVQAIYQFYLSFVLPRLEDGRDPETVSLEAPAFKALVSPKRVSDPLFPSEIDETLSTMQLSLLRADGAEGGGDIKVSSVCFDRIQVVLEWEVDLDHVPRDDELKLALRRAVGAADYYLAHYRYVARSSYVLKIPRFWRAKSGEFYVGAPYTASWFDLDSNGAWLPVFNGTNSQATSGSIRSPESGVASSTVLNTSLQTGAEPPLHRSLLIDADGYVQALALREAALSLASSCEIAAQLFIDRFGGESDPRIRSVLDLKSVSFAEKYYDKLPAAVGVESFKNGHPESFTLIEEMYRQRNSLIHSGAFKGDVSSLEDPERQLVVHSWLLAAQEAVDWIDGVSPAT